MRKRLLTALILLAIIPVASRAYDVYIDGVYYNLNTNDKKAEVTGGDNKYQGDVVIPETVTYEDVEYSIHSIGNYAFSSCAELTTINIPSSITSIGNSAFQFCTNLTSVDLPNSISYIGMRAFWGCYKLTSINIPYGITTIEYDCFAGSVFRVL